MRSISLVLFLSLLALQYKLWFGDGSVQQWMNLEKKIAEQEKVNQMLERGNKGLEANIAELKKGDQGLEEEARFELGMIKENETYYQFVD